MKYLTLVFLASGLALRLGGSPAAPDDAGIGFGIATASLGAALAGAERVEIYEGLPNPLGEREHFEGEKHGKICRQVGDQWVYCVPQTARFETVLAL